MYPIKERIFSARDSINLFRVLLCPNNQLHKVTFHLQQRLLTTPLNPVTKDIYLMENI